MRCRRAPRRRRCRRPTLTKRRGRRPALRFAAAWAAGDGRRAGGASPTPTFSRPDARPRAGVRRPGGQRQVGASASAVSATTTLAGPLGRAVRCRRADADAVVGFRRAPTGGGHGAHLHGVARRAAPASGRFDDRPRWHNWITVSKTLTAYTCSSCGHQSPKWMGRCTGVRRVEHAGRGGRPRGAAAAGRPPPGPRSAPLSRGSGRPRRPGSRPGWASSTGCSAAGWFPGRWCWSAASRASARARCCCRRWAPSARPACARCWSAARSRRRRCACGPSGWASPTTCRCWPRPSSRRSATPSRWSARTSSSSTPCRRCTPPTCRRRRAASPRCARPPTGCCALAKRDNITIVLVGHVTKDGSVAGPRVLEHLVDAVLQFEGDRYRFLRVLRAVKNRFGSTNEIGIFEMTDAGLQPGRRSVGRLLVGRRAGPRLGAAAGDRGHAADPGRGAGAGRARATWRCRAAPRPASTATGWR